MGHNTCAGITLPPKFVVFEVRPLVSHNEDLNSPKQRGQSTATHQHLPPSTSGERGLPAHQRPLGRSSRERSFCRVKHGYGYRPLVS